MKLLTVAGIAALALAAAAFAGIAEPEPALGVESPEQRVVTVSGTAIVESVPDEASFSVGVVSNGRTAREALAANGIEVQRLIEALRRAGVEERDVQTEQVSLMPRYSDSEEIVGYSASNTVAVELHKLDGAGAIIDAAVDAGANQVYGPDMTRSNQEELYRRALRAAIANARERAQAMAAASGVSLGRVLTISETGSAPPPIPFAREMAQPAASTPIEPGTEETLATVTVTFALA